MKVYECLLCKESTAYVPNPGLPDGAVFGRWEGWFHLDAEKEHFTPVGFRDLEFKQRENYIHWAM